jgi:hypothetical protein
MQKAVKKLFDWTPRDVAAWEKIRVRGLWHFVLWYGVLISAGILLIITGAITLLAWVRAPVNIPAAELGFDAIVCLLAALINSLVTWVVEEHIYQRITKLHSK